MADTAEEKRKKDEESITDIMSMLYGGGYAYYRPASFRPAVLTSDDNESPAADAVTPVAVTTGAAGAAVATQQTEPETTETVMELRGSDGQLIALDPAVLEGRWRRGIVLRVMIRA